MTVTCSGPGWKCGGMVYPSGSESRIVYGPGLAGSPSRTAIFAPVGSTGGAAFHVIESGTSTTTCCVDARFGVWAITTTGTATALSASNNPFMDGLDLVAGYVTYYGRTSRVQAARYTRPAARFSVSGRCHLGGAGTRPGTANTYAPLSSIPIPGL